MESIEDEEGDPLKSYNIERSQRSKSMVSTSPMNFMKSPSCGQQHRKSAPIPSDQTNDQFANEISNLYSRVRRSQTLYTLGIDEDGQVLQPEPKCYGIFTKCIPNKSAAGSTAADTSTFDIDSTASIHSKLPRRRSTNNMQVYRARKGKFAKKYAEIVNHPIYKLMTMLFAVGALYTKDLCYAVLPKTADFWALNVVLSVIFFWLFLELILYSITFSNYCFTFFFWLDLIGTASILIDIPWILLGIGLKSNIFLIVKGGRMGRAARGAGSIRFIKLIKMVRMIKLFRLLNVFRKRRGEEDTDDKSDDNEFLDSDSEIKPSRMGSLLADRVTQKVILGVLVAFLITPLFDPEITDTGDKTFFGLAELESTYTKYHDTATGQFLHESAEGDYEDVLDLFNLYHEDVLFLQIGSNSGDGMMRTPEIDDPNDELRIEERAEYITESGVSSAILNIRSNVMEEAILNICLTTFMMAIFAVGSFIISVDTFMLVYPLEYLVVVLKRLSSITVHMYKRQNPNQDEEGLLHGDLFQEIMKSMTKIFYGGKREELFIKSLDAAAEGQESMAPRIHDIMNQDIEISVEQ